MYEALLHVNIEKIIRFIYNIGLLVSQFLSFALILYSYMNIYI